MKWRVAINNAEDHIGVGFQVIVEVVPARGVPRLPVHLLCLADKRQPFGRTSGLSWVGKTEQWNAMKSSLPFFAG